MNARQSIRRVEEMLLAAGAVPVSHTGGHRIYRFPAGSIYPVQVHEKSWRSPRLLRRVVSGIRRTSRADPARQEADQPK